MAQLQRSVGNAAVARALAGPAGPVLQRSPSSWKAATADIGKLKGGLTLKSRWPAVVTLVKHYATLSAANLGGRTATLLNLEQSIQKWQANQAKNLFKSALDLKKADAVDRLTPLIAQERREIAALQANQQPQPAAPPLAQPQPQPQPQPLAFAQPQPQPQPNPFTLAPPPSAPWTIAADESFEEDEETAFKLPSSLDDLPFALDLEEKPRARGGERYYEKEKEKEEKREEKREEVESAELSGSEEHSLEEEYEPLPKDASKDPQFPFAVHLRVHMTRKDYLESIRGTGLIAGKEQGIGLPDESEKRERAPDPAYLYALDLSNRQTTQMVAMEAGGEPIGMVSVNIGDKDVNYPKGGAVRYPPRAPPVRQFPQEGDATYSFALPMTPRTTAGLTRFVNQHTRTPMTEDEVAKLVEISLRRKIPLHVLKKFPKKKPTQ